MFYGIFGGYGVFLDFLAIMLLAAGALSWSDRVLRLDPDRRWRYGRPPPPSAANHAKPHTEAPLYATIRGPY